MGNALTSDSNEEEQVGADELAPGTQLLHGQYVIESFLNAGGFGITYLAKDSLERKVVIKECFPGSFCRRSRMIVQARSRAHEPELKSIVRLFVQEARSLAKLIHPNIVGVHQVFEDNDTAYMALDFVEGRDLLDTLEDPNHGLKPDQIKDILRSMLDAVGFIHNQGMLHRDISPDNILLDQDMRPVLIDFGAAREEASKKSRVLSALRVVKDGYSPQEFYISGSEQAPCSDLYALGATFFHLITGNAPPNSQARLAAIATGETDPYKMLSETFSGKGYETGVLKSIDKALCVMPKQRVQSAQEWLDVMDGKDVEDGDKGEDSNVTALKTAATSKAATSDSASAPANDTTQPKSKMGLLMASVATVALIGVGVSMSGVMDKEPKAPVEVATTTSLALKPALKAATNPDAKPDAKAAAKPAADAPVPPKVVPAAKPAAAPEVKLAATPVAKPDLKPDLKSEIKPMLKPLERPALEKAAEPKVVAASETDVSPAVQASTVYPGAFGPAETDVAGSAHPTGVFPGAFNPAETDVADSVQFAGIYPGAFAKAETDIAQSVQGSAIYPGVFGQAETEVAASVHTPAPIVPPLVAVLEIPKVPVDFATGTPKTTQELLASGEIEMLSGQPVSDPVEGPALGTIVVADLPDPSLIVAPDTPTEPALVAALPLPTAQTPQKDANTGPVIAPTNIADFGETVFPAMDVIAAILPGAEVLQQGIEFIAEGEPLGDGKIAANWQITLPFKSSKEAPATIDEIAGVAPVWAEPGLKVTSVNDTPVTDFAQINGIVQASFGPETNTFVEVKFGTKTADGETIQQEATFPVFYRTELSNGMTFDSKLIGDEWQTFVASMPEGIDSDIRIGDQIMAYIPTSERVSQANSLQQIIERETANDVSQFTFAVTRDGQMWVASLSYSSEPQG